MDTAGEWIHHCPLCALPLPSIYTHTSCLCMRLGAVCDTWCWGCSFPPMRQQVCRRKGNVLTMAEQKDRKNLVPGDIVWATGSTLHWTIRRLPFTKDNLMTLLLIPVSWAFSYVLPKASWLLRPTLCPPPKFKCWSPSPQDLKTGLYLERRSLKTWFN